MFGESPNIYTFLESLAGACVQAANYFAGRWSKIPHWVTVENDLLARNLDLAEIFRIDRQHLGKVCVKTFLNSNFRQKSYRHSKIRKNREKREKCDFAILRGQVVHISSFFITAMAENWIYSKTGSSGTEIMIIFLFEV